MDDTNLNIALLEENNRLFDGLLNPIKKRKYWYKTDRYICVLCGAESVYRERQYTERPEDYNKRNIIHQDACNHHFI